jgi:hypothetical protein
MPRARFLGTGMAVPDRVVTNDDLSRVMDTSDEWIAPDRHPERRWVREGETSADWRMPPASARSSRGHCARRADAIIYRRRPPTHFARQRGYLQYLRRRDPLDRHPNQQRLRVHCG